MSDDDRKAWETQFNSNFGAREYVRLSAALLAWILLGVSLAAVSRLTPLFYLFLISGFAFPFITRRWRPGYRLLLVILGNKDLPQEPMPRGAPRPQAFPRPWWSFVPGLWFLFLTLILFYLVVRYFLK